MYDVASYSSLSFDANILHFISTKNQSEHCANQFDRVIIPQDSKRTEFHPITYPVILTKPV